MGFGNRFRIELKWVLSLVSTHELLWKSFRDLEQWRVQSFHSFCFGFYFKINDKRELEEDLAHNKFEMISFNLVWSKILSDSYLPFKRVPHSY